MNSARFIGACWAVLAVYWIISAIGTKRTAVRASGWSWLWGWVVIAAVLAARRRGMPIGGGPPVWHSTPSIRAAADVIVAAGLAVALWARTVLGRNWSSMVVLKRDHELIEGGPYRYVRHPIYSGVLLMLLGTALIWNSQPGLLAFAAGVVGLAVKARTEERLLTAHFPEAYPAYRRRVRAAIVPFIL